MSLSQQQLGFHYYPDTDHYNSSDLDDWLPVLKSAGASWLTLRANASSPVPRLFLEGLLQNGIQPIVHVTDLVGTLRMAQVYTNLKDYVDSGVEIVIFYDRPNMRASWPASSWSHEGLVTRFVDTLTPVLEAQVEMGLKPTIPPLEPGGDYWDTAFLESCLALLTKRTSEDVMAGLTLTTYMWSYGKPLDWGQGGHRKWPEARPYSSPEGSQDQRGFQINDWYQEIAERITGHRLPTIVVAGGAGPSQAYSSPEAIQIGNNEVARYLAEEGVSDEILNFCFYPLTTAENHQDFPAAWYLPVESKQVSEKEDGAVEVTVPCGKPIQHYVLIGLSNQVNGLQVWNAIAPPIISARATVGFSLEEARHAARVSIVGNYQTMPGEIDAELLAGGATVERFESWNTDEFLLAASSWAAKSPVTGVGDD